MKQKRIRMWAAYLIALSLLMQVPAFGAEPHSGRITVSDSAEADSFETESEIQYNNLDFGGAKGNFLIAVNPEPWVNEYDEPKCFDNKFKELGYIDSAAAFEAPEKKSHEEGDHSSGEEEKDPFHVRQCKSMELKAKINARPEKKQRVADEAGVSYEVGDVILRMVEKSVCGISDSAILKAKTGNSNFIPRIYQCIYVGDYSTIWSSISEDKLTDAEKAKLEEAEKTLKEYGDKEDGDENWKDKAYKGTGKIDVSENNDRTLVIQTLSNNDYTLDEIGENFDKYIKSEKEYTGDYLYTDSDFGDNDKKAAFLIEPTDTYTFGYFWGIDLDEFHAGDCQMDCLHLNIKMCGQHPDYLYTTMLHELQHLIIYGYYGEAETWIDEWMAQGVSMQVYGQGSKDVNSYISSVSGPDGYNLNNKVILSPYAYGNNVDTAAESGSNMYSIAYPLTQYFEEHVDKKFVKTFTENLESCNTGSLTDYLRENTPHSLEGWLALFDIALTAGIDGTTLNIPKGSDYDIGDSTVIKNTLAIYKEYKDLVYDALGSFKDLQERGQRIIGGGTCKAYLNKEDTPVEILDAEEGVVWVLRNSKGEIVGVEGLSDVDKKDTRTYTTKTIPVPGVIPAAVNIKMYSDINFQGKLKPDADALDLNISISFNNPQDKGKVSVSSLEIGPLSLKNTSAVYTYGDGSNEKKRPTLKNIKVKALPGATKTEKAFIKELNSAIKKELKKDPFYFDILPRPLNECSPTIKLKNGNTDVKKVTCFFEEKKFKFKDTDFEPIFNDDNTKVIGIKGKGNFTGEFYLPGADRLVAAD